MEAIPRLIVATVHAPQEHVAPENLVDQGCCIVAAGDERREVSLEAAQHRHMQHKVEQAGRQFVDDLDAVAAEISVGPKSEGRAQLVREGRGALGTTSGVALVPGRTHLLEFAFVDRRVHFALDGKEVIPAADLEPAANRGEVRRPLQLGARGCRLVVRGLRLSRDIHYTQYGEHGTRHPAVLGPREYYVLGDNSGNSQDSRKWPTPQC